MYLIIDDNCKKHAKSCPHPDESILFSSMAGFIKYMTGVTVKNSIRPTQHSGVLTPSKTIFCNVTIFAHAWQYKRQLSFVYITK
jgi:hypothetical protein